MLIIKNLSNNFVKFNNSKCRVVIARHETSLFAINFYTKQSSGLVCKKEDCFVYNIKAFSNIITPRNDGAIFFNCMQYYKSNNIKVL